MRVGAATLLAVTALVASADVALVASQLAAAARLNAVALVEVVPFLLTI